MKFKVGDKVKCIDPNLPNTCTIPFGTIAEIKDRYGICTVEWHLPDGNTNLDYHEKSLELVIQQINENKLRKVLGLNK